VTTDPALDLGKLAPRKPKPDPREEFSAQVAELAAVIVTWPEPTEEQERERRECLERLAPGGSSWQWAAKMRAEAMAKRARKEGAE
jgi:hypothetical protein